jgi:hypothetical protein
MQEINAKQWYTPREIVDNGWIVSTGNSNDSHYNFVLRQIAAGKLKAHNYASGKAGRPYWRVLGSEVIRYKRETEGGI